MEFAQTMQKSNRIAICLSGQVRSWKKCYKSWNLIWENAQNPNVDFFIHTWDQNTHPAKFGNFKPPQQVEKEEIDEIIEILKPKKIIFEQSRKFLIEGEDTYLNHSPYLSQYYGVLRCSRLKKEYEIENNFLYDVVVRLRFDLLLEDPVLFGHDIKLKERTIYGIHYGYDSTKNSFRFGDMIFYSDSFTYDILADYYYGVNFLPKEWFDSSVPPEFGWYYYFKSNNIDLESHSWGVKIVRQGEDYMLSKESNYEIF